MFNIRYVLCPVQLKYFFVLTNSFQPFDTPGSRQIEHSEFVEDYTDNDRWYHKVNVNQSDDDYDSQQGQSDL